MSVCSGLSGAQIFWDPTDCSPSGSSVHGILQLIILEWGAISSSRRSSWPKDHTRVSCISYLAGMLFTAERPEKPRTGEYVSLYDKMWLRLGTGEKIKLNYPGQSKLITWILKSRQPLLAVVGERQRWPQKDLTSTTWGFPCGSDGKESACNMGDWVWSLRWEVPLEKGMVTHSSILAWRIPWTEELGGLWSWNCK